MSYEKLNKCKVVSKYFACQTVMDESLSDFQEEKKKIAGPSNPRKLKTNKTQSKSKNKKLPKCGKGQKDIRSALKLNNELQKYTKDFNNICASSGLDIDGEQLQLAIALSKSLQDSSSDSDNIVGQSSQFSSIKHRTAKIRTTLQEYGFKVPTKLVVPVNKRPRNIKQHYKLISTKEEEKQQKITDKYTQILFENCNNDLTTRNVTQSSCDVSLFYLACGITFKAMKNNNVFYVTDLIERCPNSVGSLLKNWAQIPGRPQSPIAHKLKMDVSEIECSQEELDVMLSGKLFLAKGILKEKYFNALKQLNDVVGENSQDSNKIDITVDTKTKQSNRSTFDDQFEISKDRTETAEKLSPKMVENVILNPENSTTSFRQKCRSPSPDMFEDEMFQSTEKTKLSISFHETQNDMEFTDCVSVPNKICPLSQSTDTKMESNDFMEITDCVVTSSQPIRDNILCNIDLTQSNNDNNIDCKKVEKSKNIVGNVQITDLTQTSSSDDDTLPYVNIGSTRECSLDDTIVLQSEEYLRIATLKDENVNVVCAKEVLHTLKPCISEENDRENIEISSELSTHYKKTNSSNQSFEEYVYQHSNSGLLKSDFSDCTNEKENIQVTHAENKKKIHSIDMPLFSDSNEIDLTQTSDSNDSNTNHIDTSDMNSKQQSGEVIVSGNYDISVDYDEINSFNKTDEYSLNEEQCSQNKCQDNENVEHINGNEFDSPRIKSTSNTCNANLFPPNVQFIRNKDECVIQCQDNTKETLCIEIINTQANMQIKNNVTSPLNSENKPDGINVHFGGISLLDDITEVSTGDNKKVDLTKTVRKNQSVVSFVTPSHKYTIKTEHVTPLLDYESMSTPERNNELEKFGLKPLKRRRAVKLLNHIYNQTHPIIEQITTPDDCSSFSKKCKYDLKLSLESTSPREANSSSPRKANYPNPRKANSPSPTKANSSNKLKSPKEPTKENLTVEKENIYEVTKQSPDIKDIDCKSEDWIFQKKEKVKVHSCRVPLHIAFHNYVSCRRRLREAILRYEPVNIDVIHKDLIVSGHRYDPKDLLKFLDKKCITVKTADSNSGKRY